MTKPPFPWDDWDDVWLSYGCRHCGAAAYYRVHNPGCKYLKEPPKKNWLKRILGL